MIWAARDLTQWHRAFAWWPTYVGDNRFAWLEWVERRSKFYSGECGHSWEYRT